MSFAPINGIDLYYEQAGEGDAIIFIHAGIADSRMWDAQFAEFAKQYHVIRYDMHSFGQSQPNGQTYNMFTDLGALLDYLNIEKATLIGCSMGGTLAIDFTLENPDRVRALVTVCSRPRGYPMRSEPDPMWDELDAVFDTGDMGRVSEMETDYWVVGKYRTRDQVNPAIWQPVYEMNKIPLQHEYDEKVGEHEPNDLGTMNRLHEIKAPTLAIVGQLDHFEITEAAGKMAAEMSNATLRVMGNAAHMPSMEHSAVFNALVLDFLSQQG